MLLNSAQNEYLSMSNEAGFRTYIHNASYYPFTDNIGYNVPAGYVSTFALTQVFEKFLNNVKIPNNCRK